MSVFSRTLALALLCLGLNACFQVELGGSVPGASISITDLRTGEVIETGLTSRTLEEFLQQKSQNAWDRQGDLGKMINLGNFDVTGGLYDSTRWYLITATAGADMDSDADGTISEPPFTPVSGTWRALIRGGPVKKGGFMISAITEALYQAVRADITSLSDQELGARLNQLTRTILSDVNDDGATNYTDALSWTVLLHRDLYLLDFDRLLALIEGIRSGVDAEAQATLAAAAMGQDQPDAFEVFTQQISGPLIQARCVRCHTANGSAPARGARLILVTNSNSDHNAINHQVFIDFAGILGAGNDLSTFVMSKVDGSRSHGGGVQVPPGSENHANFDAYLNLVEME